MWLKPICGLGVTLCLLSMATCDGAGSSSARDNPPAISYRVATFSLTSPGIAETIRGAFVTNGFFPAAKTQPLVGRLFLPEEYQSGRHQVVIVSNRLWHQSFKADPGWIGRSVQLNGQAFTIVGIMPPTFEIPSGADLWVPKAQPAD